MGLLGSSYIYDIDYIVFESVSCTCIFIFLYLALFCIVWENVYIRSIPVAVTFV